MSKKSVGSTRTSNFARHTDSRSVKESLKEKEAIQESVEKEENTE